MLEFIKKMLGGGSDAAIKKLEKIAQQVEALDEPYRRLSDEELRGKTAEFKARLEKGETLDDLLPEAFAAIREADARVLGDAALTMCRFWAASCCIRDASPR